MKNEIIKLILILSQLGGGGGGGGSTGLTVENMALVKE